ncbi:MAG: hypothetical protein ACKO97_06940, partial [Actinomycetota bacterium]
WLDMPLMRVMDGIMAIPGILIAIALVALWKASLMTVIVAIAIPESMLAALLRWEERRSAWFDHLRFFHVFGLVKR